MGYRPHPIVLLLHLLLVARSHRVHQCVRTFLVDYSQLTHSAIDALGIKVGVALEVTIVAHAEGIARSIPLG